MQFCAGRKSILPNYHLLGQDGLIGKVTSLKPKRSVKVSVKEATCTLTRGHHKKPVNCSSSVASLINDRSKWESVLKTDGRTYRKNGIRASLQKGNTSSSNDRDIWASFMSSVIWQLNCLYRFSRPYTVIGTIIGITSVSLLPLQSIVDLSPLFFMGLMKALVPSVLMNIYVVGLNQLFDVELDKINKPNLPLASGDFSTATAATIVFASLLMSLALGVMFQSPPVLYALLITFVIGSVYSIDLPLLRWKKHAFLAASCILMVRAIVVQIAFFTHIQKFVLGKPIFVTRSLVFAVLFMCFFSAVIALYKDIPDVDGDRDYGIQSFSVSLGPKRVYWLCVNLLCTAYGAATVVGATSSFFPSKLVTILGHSTLAFILWLRAQSTDLTSKASITSFYMFIWKLFYAEYFLIPFVR